MAIATSKTREQFPLSTKKVLKKTVVGTLALCTAIIIMYAILGFALIGSHMGGAPFGIVSGIALVALFVLILVVYLYQKWYYNVYFYDLTADFIVIKKGPITPTEITIPYERVQDVYVDQDIWDRIFGLYDVHLSSATASSGMEAHIDGVEKPAADGLRALLLQTVSNRISKKGSTAPTTLPVPEPPVPPVKQS